MRHFTSLVCMTLGGLPYLSFCFLKPSVLYMHIICISMYIPTCNCSVGFKLLYIGVILKMKGYAVTL